MSNLNEPRLASRLEGGRAKQEGGVCGWGEPDGPPPAGNWGWSGPGPAQPTPVIQLRLDRRPTNPTPFLWAPRGSGGFVYESSSLLPQPSPKPASRVAWVLWEGETGPAPARPPFFSFPFLPPAFAVDTGEGRYFFQTCRACRGSCSFLGMGSWVWRNSLLNSGGDSGLLVLEEEIEKETASFLVKEKLF